MVSSNIQWNKTAAVNDSGASRRLLLQRDVMMTCPDEVEADFVVQFRRGVVGARLLYPAALLVTEAAARVFERNLGALFYNCKDLVHPYMRCPKLLLKCVKTRS